MDWMLDAGIEICNTLAQLEENGRDLSATECKNIIAKHYAAQRNAPLTGAMRPHVGDPCIYCGATITGQSTNPCPGK